MSELIKIVVSLETRVSRLLHKLETLQKTNESLENELVLIRDEYSFSKKIVLDWEEKYNSLKLANTMLGSNTNKTEAKLKINTLIRELDHCIGQLVE